MKVRIMPGDRGGAVGNYRVRYPAATAANLGVQIEEYGPGVPSVMTRRLIQGDGPPRLEFTVTRALDADVLVLQRPSNPYLVDMIPRFQRKGVAVVVDVDDDVDVIPRGNVAKGGENARAIRKACSLADLVTVSTPALVRRYGAHGRVVVLPNRVPERLLGMPRQSDGRTVGWAGAVGVHPGDLQVTGGGVAQAVQETGAAFVQVGPIEGVLKALGLREALATGGVALAEYEAHLGRLDVGIAPLADSLFNAAKSCLKPLEMTARGAAVLMSPRPDYERVHADGVGRLVKDRGRSWRRAVRELLQDPTERLAMVAYGQQAIREAHTYEVTGHLWVEAWERAVRNHRAQVRRIGLSGTPRNPLVMV